MLVRTLVVGGSQLGLHLIQTVHSRFDGSNRVKVLIKFSPVSVTQAFLQLARILKCEVGDVAGVCAGLRAEEPVVDLSRVSH